jgi:DnaA-like protein
MVRQRRRNLGSDVDQVEGQRPSQGERGSWTLRPLLLFRHSERSLRSEESLTTILHNCLGWHLWKEILRCAQNDGYRAPRLFGHSHMLLTSIARQIEAQARVRTRRYEAEYLANIFGLDYFGLNCRELPRCAKTPPLFEDIVRAVGEATRVAPAEFCGRSRRQHIAYARQLAMYLVRQITRAPYPLIGDFFGRSHATVIYACESMRARLPFDAEGRRALDKIATIFSDRRRELQQDMGKE